MTSTINASSTGSGGIVQTADASGVLALQSNGTTAITVNSDATTTFANAANLPNTFGFKNRLINGAMVIDQRNAGASGTATGVYTVDRWGYTATQAAKGTWGQNLNSVTPPTGFINYLGFQSSSAYSVAAGDFFSFYQGVEGLNVADLSWGTANAKTITLSFQVYSSLTGTFGGSIRNGSSNYSYPFTFSIPVANTWTTISITVTGPTAGTFVTTNAGSFYIFINLGCGSTYTGTAGSWSANNYLSATGATSVVGTNNATFYITGVQLEKGSVATSFDVRPYTTELALCQRYFCKNSSTTVVATNGTAYGTAGMFSTGAFQAFGANTGYCQWISFPVAMRTEPTTIAIINPNLSPTAGTWAIYNAATPAWVAGTPALQSSTTSGFGLVISGVWAAGPIMWYGAWTASAEL